MSCFALLKINPPNIISTPVTTFHAFSLQTIKSQLFFVFPDFCKTYNHFCLFPIEILSVTSTTSWLGLIFPLLGPQDNDSHLSFITHAANLRAENYGISPVDKFQVRPVGRLLFPSPPPTPNFANK